MGHHTKLFILIHLVMYPDFGDDAPYKGPTQAPQPRPNQAPRAKKSYFSKEYGECYPASKRLSSRRSPNTRKCQ